MVRESGSVAKINHGVFVDILFDINRDSQQDHNKVLSEQLLGSALDFGVKQIELVSLKLMGWFIWKLNFCVDTSTRRGVLAAQTHHHKSILSCVTCVS